MPFDLLLKKYDIHNYMFINTSKRKIRETKERKNKSQNYKNTKLLNVNLLIITLCFLIH